VSDVLILPKFWAPLPYAEESWGDLSPKLRRHFGDLLLIPSWGDRVLKAVGSMCNDLQAVIVDEILGGTAYSAVATHYMALYTAAIDDTLNGATANEAAYTSYARLALTNNTTIFAAGSTATGKYTKTFPSDAAKTWATSTGGSSVCTYLGMLSGNAGTSADKGEYAAAISSVTIASGDTPRLAQNAATVTQD
jgi:hypothetical protein